MGLITTVYKTAVGGTYAKKAAEWAIDKVKPLLADYIENYPVEDRLDTLIDKKYDPENCDEETLETYANASDSLQSFMDNMNKYNTGDEAESDSMTQALITAMGKVSEYSEDNPEGVGCLLVNEDNGEQGTLLQVAESVNEKVAEAEANGEEITASTINGWAVGALAGNAVDAAKSTVGKFTDGQTKDRGETIETDLPIDNSDTGYSSLDFYK